MEGNALNITNKELSKMLRIVSGTTLGLACLGCGYEHNCKGIGCVLLRTAAKRLEESPCCNEKMETMDGANGMISNLTGKCGNLPAVPSTFAVEELWVLSEETQRCLQDIFERLNAYERSGLEPEYIASPEPLPIVTELRAKLARYEKAEKDGHILVVPEKLYDVIYDEAIPGAAYINEHQTDGGYIKFAGDYISPEEIGETVFLTEEEAEAALKEMEGKNH